MPLPFQRRVLRVMVVTVLRLLFQALLLCMREAEEVVRGRGPRWVQQVAQGVGVMAHLNLHAQHCLETLIQGVAEVVVAPKLLFLGLVMLVGQG